MIEFNTFYATPVNGKIKIDLSSDWKSVALMDIVFFDDGDGNMLFGGGTEWTGEVTSIAAWGAEAGLNNCFNSGDEFTFGLVGPSDAKLRRILTED